MKKFYIVGPKNEGEGLYTLVADTGEGLASHFCSHAGYALSDLEQGRPERKEKWKKEFGEYKVLYIGDDEMTRDELMKRNEEWHQSHKDDADKMPKPSVVIEVNNP